MNANHIESKFGIMGARLKVSVLPEQRVSEDYAVDIQIDRHGEYFELRVPETLSQRLDVNVLQTEKRKPTRCATWRSSINRIKTSSGAAKLRCSSRFPFCRSKAERSPDKRENAEHYRAGRPFPRVAEAD